MLDTGTEKIQYQVERLIGTITEPDLNNMIVGGGVLHASLDEPIINSSQTTKGYIDLKIKRAAKSGSQTLAWNGSVWESPLANSDGSSGSDSNGVKYDQLLGWVYFTDTPWVYSYTNGSWYYMHSTSEGLYVWNANLPNGGWIKLHG